MDFQNCNFLKKLKITKPIGQMVCDKNLKKKKIRHTKSSSCWGDHHSMWFFFLETFSKGSKLNSKIGRFLNIFLILSVKEQVNLKIEFIIIPQAPDFEFNVSIILTFIVCMGTYNMAMWNFC